MICLAKRNNGNDCHIDSDAIADPAVRRGGADFIARWRWEEHPCCGVAQCAGDVGLFVVDRVAI